MCQHRPPCPPADRPDRDAARTVAFHPEQGWSLLCNGVIVFDDMGEILPGGRVVPLREAFGDLMDFDTWLERSGRARLLAQLEAPPA